LWAVFGWGKQKKTVVKYKYLLEFQPLLGTDLGQTSPVYGIMGDGKNI